MRISNYLAFFFVLTPTIVLAASGTSEDFVRDLERIMGASLSGAITGTGQTQTPPTTPTTTTPPTTTTTTTTPTPPAQAPIVVVPVTVLPSQNEIVGVTPPKPSQNSTEVAFNSAPKSSENPPCNLPAIDRIYARVTNGASDIRWLTVPGATGYNLYKRTLDNTWVLVSTLSVPSYRIHLAPGAIKYEDFAVRALCAVGKESGNISGSTSVQTGPTLYFILLGSFLVGYFVVRRYISFRE